MASALAALVAWAQVTGAGEGGEQSIQATELHGLGHFSALSGPGCFPSSPADCRQVGFTPETAVSSNEKPSNMLLLGFFSVFSS